MPLTKRERDEVSEMMNILNELRFVGIERDANLEDLQRRAKEILQYSLFRDVIHELLQGGLDVEVLDDYKWPDPAPLSDEDLAALYKRLRDLPSLPMKFVSDEEDYDE